MDSSYLLLGCLQPFLCVLRAVLPIYIFFIFFSRPQSTCVCIVAAAAAAVAGGRQLNVEAKFEL